MVALPVFALYHDVIAVVAFTYTPPALRLAHAERRAWPPDANNGHHHRTSLPTATLLYYLPTYL